VIYRIDYAGKSITFSGDIDAKGLPGLRSIAKGCDLLAIHQNYTGSVGFAEDGMRVSP
jgi:hypothetical protein